MIHSLSNEIKEFHIRTRAKAVLIAVEWAGSATALAELVGFNRYTGTKWVQRGAISPLGAVRLAQLKGFPLTASEMASGIDLSMFSPRRCPKCDAVINPPNYSTGRSPLLKASTKRARKKRLKQILEANASRKSL